MISVMKMIVNQDIFRFALGSFRLFRHMEKVRGDPVLVQANRSHIHPKRRGTERLAEHLLIPYRRDILEDMILQFMVHIIVVPIAAPTHYNEIYIFDGQIIAQQNFVDGMARLQDSRTIENLHILQFAQCSFLLLRREQHAQRATAGDRTALLPFP